MTDKAKFGPTAAGPAIETHMVALRGSMSEIVAVLADAIVRNLVVSISKITPCSETEYSLCPLAALVDPEHAHHTPTLAQARSRMMAANA